MSHFTKLTAEIKDLETLKLALLGMNLKLETNTSCRYYYGEEQKKFVIKLPGPYDVALEKNSNGSYDLNADFYQGHVEKHIGHKGEKLLRQYSIEKLKIEAKKNGYKVYPTEEGMKIMDPKTGGKVEVKILPNGQIDIKTSGFKGQSCMKFAEIEKVLGKIESCKKTSEYYDKGAEVARLREWS